MVLIPEADDAVAKLAIQAYDISARDISVLNRSENSTYVVDLDDHGTRAILRVHREGYHDHDQIQSELDWIAALRRDADIRTPRVLPTSSGDEVCDVIHEERPRHAVLFELVPGSEPTGDAHSGAFFTRLGELTARLHQHAESWDRPASFSRFAWDWTHMIGDNARWGNWRECVTAEGPEDRLLSMAVAAASKRLYALDARPRARGLIHADMRAANLLADGDDIAVIDFDDCGWSWFLYDFATAVSFVEHDPRLGEWQDAWLEGYRRRRELDAVDVEALPTLVLLRRLMLLAWMGSHSYTDEAQQRAEYLSGTCDLAETYLASGGKTICH